MTRHFFVPEISANGMGGSGEASERTWNDQGSHGTLHRVGGRLRLARQQRLGRSPWNRTQSTPPAREPVLNDVTAEISRVDSTHVQWSLTVLASQGQTSTH